MRTSWPLGRHVAPFYSGIYSHVGQFQVHQLGWVSDTLADQVCSSPVCFAIVMTIFSMFRQHRAKLAKRKQQPTQIERIVLGLWLTR